MNDEVRAPQAMLTPEQWHLLRETLESLFLQMQDQQRYKLVRMAHRVRPDLSEDDLRDPHSFPEVTQRFDYAFEDGILAGIISAQTAALAELRAMAENEDYVPRRPALEPKES
ncbi:MAG: hypothetical protein SFY68_02645 [Candidatus Sumerlaeia bacterium]|nr:hypothetical protein [Candidatus Sumerlaeia bacterium]